MKVQEKSYTQEMFTLPQKQSEETVKSFLCNMICSYV